MTQTEKAQCICKGRSVEFRGEGKNTQYRLCALYRDSHHPEGHLSLGDARALIEERMQNIKPNRRFA